MAYGSWPTMHAAIARRHDRTLQNHHAAECGHACCFCTHRPNQMQCLKNRVNSDVSQARPPAPAGMRGLCGLFGGRKEIMPGVTISSKLWRAAVCVIVISCTRDGVNLAVAGVVVERLHQRR